MSFYLYWENYFFPENVSKEKIIFRINMVIVSIIFRYGHMTSVNIMIIGYMLTSIINMLYIISKYRIIDQKKKNFKKQDFKRTEESKTRVLKQLKMGSQMTKDTVDQKISKKCLICDGETHQLYKCDKCYLTICSECLIHVNKKCCLCCRKNPRFLPIIDDKDVPVEKEKEKESRKEKRKQTGEMFYDYNSLYSGYVPTILSGSCCESETTDFSKEQRNKMKKYM